MTPVEPPTGPHKAPRYLPDVNPADAAVARVTAQAAELAALDQVPPSPRELEFQERILRLENLLQATLDSLNAGTIEAVCNVDTTITVTLTLPSLPT